METACILNQLYIVEGSKVSLADIIDVNAFKEDDELFQTIAKMQIGETIGEDLNIATITRIY